MNLLFQIRTLVLAEAVRDEKRGQAVARITKLIAAVNAATRGVLVHVGAIQIEQLHRTQSHSAQDFVGSHIVQSPVEKSVATFT